MSAEQVLTTHKKEFIMDRIRTVFEGEYSWVEIDDELWATAILTDYVAGIELPHGKFRQ